MIRSLGYIVASAQELSNLSTAPKDVGKFEFLVDQRAAQKHAERRLRNDDELPYILVCEVRVVDLSHCTLPLTMTHPDDE